MHQIGRKKMAEFTIKGKKYEVSLKGPTKFVICGMLIIAWLYVTVKQPDYSLNFGIMVAAIIIFDIYCINKQEHLRILKK